MIYLRNNRGVAAVEFALCLPVLILLVCGSIEFGLLFYNQQVITNASREGVRAGITGKTVDEIKGIVLLYCNGDEDEDNKLINLNGSSELQSDLIAIPDENGDNVPDTDANNDITVSVNYNYNFLFAGILGFTDKTLSAQTTMRME